MNVVGMWAVGIGLLVVFITGITLTTVSVPDSGAAGRVAKEMAYINPVSFTQAERILPNVLTRVQIPGGWYFHEHHASIYGNYWRFSLGGDVAAKVCVSYNTTSAIWSAKNGVCPTRTWAL